MEKEQFEVTHQGEIKKEKQYLAEKALKQANIEESSHCCQTMTDFMARKSQRETKFTEIRN